MQKQNNKTKINKNRNNKTKNTEVKSQNYSLTGNVPNARRNTLRDPHFGSISRINIPNSMICLSK